MTRGLKAYLVAGGLVLGLHGLGGALGWWKPGTFAEQMSIRNWNLGGGGSGGGGGGFRGGK